MARIVECVDFGKNIKMGKKYVNKRKESDTYLASVGRYRWSSHIVMKVDKVCSFQPVLRPSSAESSSSAKDKDTRWEYEDWRFGESKCN